MLATNGMRFPIDVILVCIRWYAAYPLSYRHLEEMMQERGVFVDHSSINRWAIRFLPALEKVFRKHKRPVGVSWRMDETWRCCTDHAEDEVTPTPMRLMPPRLKCGRNSGVQHPACG